MKMFGNTQKTLENLVHPAEMMKQKKSIKFAYEQFQKDLEAIHLKELEKGNMKTGFSVEEISEVINNVLADMGLDKKQREVLENFFDIYVGSVKTISAEAGDLFARKVIMGKIPAFKEQKSVQADVLNSRNEATAKLHKQLHFFPELIASASSILLTNEGEISGLEIETDERSFAKVKFMFDDAPNIIIHADVEEEQIVLIRKGKKIMLFDGELL